MPLTPNISVCPENKDILRQAGEMAQPLKTKLTTKDVEFGSEHPRLSLQPLLPPKDILRQS